MDDVVKAREAALRNLPSQYALALRLRDAGVDPDEMCESLEVDPSALDTLLRLAEDKLAALRSAGAT